jgi:hypothetical protein
MGTRPVPPGFCLSTNNPEMMFVYSPERSNITAPYFSYTGEKAPILNVPIDLHNLSGEQLQEFVEYYYKTFRENEEFFNRGCGFVTPQTLEGIYSEYESDWNNTKQQDTDLQTKIRSHFQVLMTETEFIHALHRVDADYMKLVNRPLDIIKMQREHAEYRAIKNNTMLFNTCDDYRHSPVIRLPRPGE